MSTGHHLVGGSATQTPAIDMPPIDGEAGEKEKRTSTLHVGKFGKLTLAPENQMAFLDREGRTTA